MATATQPKKGRHGVLLYSAQGSQGTAVTPATAIGIGSVEVNNDADVRAIFGLGSASALFLKPGMTKVDFTLNLSEFQSKAFLAAVGVRSSGVLPYFTLGVGYVPDSGTKYAWQIQDCKCHSWDLRAERGGPVQLQLQGTGGLVTNLTSLVAANLSQSPFMFYEGVVLKGGSAYELNSIRVAVNHNVDVQAVIPGTAPSTFKRGWSYQTEGREVITAEIERFLESTVNHQGDTLTDFAVSAAFTDIGGGGNAMTLALANAVFGGETLSYSPDGDMLWRTPVLAKTFAIS